MSNDITGGIWTDEARLAGLKQRRARWDMMLPSLI